jgi:AcrR family transcriptional regulator
MHRPRLNRARIVATAIAIADEEGLAAVTLRGIAARLAVHVTSLYHHVPTKEALLGEMVRELAAKAELPRGELTWQDWVRRFAAALRALAHRHPGAFEAFHYVPAQGEHAVAALETALAAFRAGGFDTVMAYNAIKATGVAVLGLILDDTARRRSGDRRTDLDGLPAERFPGVHELADVAAAADTFGYLIDALIAGFAANLQRARASG